MNYLVYEMLVKSNPHEAIKMLMLAEKEIDKLNYKLETINEIIKHTSIKHYGTGDTNTIRKIESVINDPLEWYKLGSDK